MDYQDIEKAIQNGAVEDDDVRAFYDQSVATDRIAQARRVFNRLQGHFPNDREIRSLNIALCLQQKDYSSAMENIEAMAAICTPDDGLIDAGLSVRSKIGPIAVPHSDHTSNTVSLCMIVKNEIAGIGACLHGAKPLVDEIIVVDTGSTDRTKDVATIYGARTYDFPWCDDFAVARNFALDQARGSWILILDADEMIASSDHAALKELIVKHCQNPTALIIETRNYTHAANTIGWHANDGQYPQHEAGLGWFPSRKVRLFPNKENIRFCHPVHEQVEQALKAGDIPIVDCPIPVHHYGDLNENKKQKKARFYFKLGYDKLDQLGEDFQVIRELASQAGQLELWNEAIELWELLLRLCPDYAEAYVNISSANWQLRKYDKALAAAQRAIEIDPISKEANYNAAISLMMLGKITEAIEILQLLVNTHPEYLPSHFMLCIGFICSGHKNKCKELLSGLKTSKIGASVPMAAQDIGQRLIMDGSKQAADDLMEVVKAVYKNQYDSNCTRHFSATLNHEQIAIEEITCKNKIKINIPKDNSGINQFKNAASVCISGMHRSGTSMVARLLNLCGLYLGPDQRMMPAHLDNPNGYWEHLDIVSLNDKLLEVLGGAWNIVPHFFSEWETNKNLNSIRNAAQQVIRVLSKAPYWGWKDPRNSLTIAFWRTMLPDLKILICLRNPIEVAYSLQKRNGSSIAFGLNLWFEYNNRLIAAIKPEDRLITHYESYFNDSRKELNRVLSWIGLCANNRQIEDAISTVKVKFRRNICSTLPIFKLPNFLYIKNLYEKLCIEAEMDPTFDKEDVAGDVHFD